MSDSERIVYLILGAPGSGRREVVADLIEGGLDETDSAAVFLSAREEASALGDAAMAIWEWTEDLTMVGDWPKGADVGFFVADGRIDPVDQVEAFKSWAASHGASVVRVICVAHCALLHEHEELMAWYDACIHFSDIVLLNRRDGVPNKWVSDYQTRFAKRFLPCLVEMVRKGRIKNPALVLDQQARRMSHWFDEDDSDGWRAFVAEAEDVIIEDEAEGEEDLDETEPVDEYLERNLGGGRRKRIPDIREFLPAS
ncbi:MAG: hypothetical protein SynsKO_10920 [Synoicihabitans sp.]